MTVLVTGAAGFLGQRVTADLRGYGTEAVGLDVVPGGGGALRVSIDSGTGRQTYCGITAMIHQALDTETIVLDRDSDVPLPWIYVTDVVSAVRTALDAPRTRVRNEGTYAYNVTGPGFPTFS